MHNLILLICFALLPTTVAGHESDIYHYHTSGFFNADRPVAVAKASADGVLAAKRITVGGGVRVNLDASESYDPNGEIVHYSWRHTGGEFVDIRARNGVRAFFFAPVISDREPEPLSFTLRVTDNDRAQLEATAWVDVRKAPDPGEDDD